MRSSEEDERVGVGDRELSAERREMGQFDARGCEEGSGWTLYLMSCDLTTNPVFWPVRMSETSDGGRGGDSEERNDSRAVSKKPA